MSKTVQTGEFFVVGGSVAWDRPSYIERAADEELYQALRQGEFCYVLEPHASGKSSLMGRTARRLREYGQLAAVVDLTQIGVRERDATAGRWYYSIAYRIVRELRLKVDLQGWWQERNTLSGEQRLSEFFREIVLANSTAPVCIFIDEVERTVGAPFAEALFASIKGCYTARIAEPDYGRLNFVMLGAASPRELVSDPDISPFEEGHRVVLEDFTLDELQQLAPGFGLELSAASELLRRIFRWTGGQPYLTQKLARQAARADVSDADARLLDRLVQERFLAPAANRDEALFNHIRSVLTTPGAHTRQALALLGRVCKGMPIASDPESGAQNLLRLSGLIIDTADGRLALRNRIYEQVFTARWVNSVLPFEWRGFVLAAVGVLVLVLVPLGYFQLLPRPYIRTMSEPASDVPSVLGAYESLRALPGFADTADRLLTDVMARRSQQADSFAAATEADQALRRIPGFGAQADQLLSEFWFRQAQAAAAAEQRDAALIYGVAGVEALSDPAGRALLGELIDADYDLLQRTIRVADTIVSWAMDWNAGRITVVDRAHRVFRYSMDRFEPAEVGRLTALQYVPVARDLAVDETGSVGRFELVLDLDHPAPEQLRLTLQSPDGATAQMSLAEQPVQRSGRLRVRSRGTPLSALADAGRQGIWRLGLVDEMQGAAGRLARWSLSFSAEGEIWTDTPEFGLAIPDPIRTDEINVRLSANGLLAAAIPARAEGVGALTLWDLQEGKALADLQLAAVPSSVDFVAGGTRLFTVAGNLLTLWDLERAAPIARVATEVGFTLPPARSPDGDYLMVAEALAGRAPLFSLLRASDGRLLASAEGSAQARGWSLGPGARYLAVTESDRLVRVFDPRRRGALAALAHSERIVDVVLLAGDQGLITTDTRGVIRHWTLPAQPADEVSVERLGVTRATASLTAQADRLAYQAGDYSIAMRSLDSTAGAAVRAGFRTPLELELAPDGRSLLSRSGSVLRMWQLPASAAAQTALPAVASATLDAAAEQAVLGDWDGHLRTISRGNPTLAAARDDLGLEYIGHNGPITAVAMDAGRVIAASGGSDGVVRLWDLGSGAPTAPFLRHPQGPINAVALSADGRWVASAAEYAARIWRVADGELHSEIPVNGAALAVVFSPDSARVITSDSAGNVFVADAVAPDRLQALRASEPVAALAVASSGEQIAAGGAAGNVEVWNLPDGTRAVAPLRLPSPVRSVAFSSDGGHLLVQTASWYHRLRVTAGGLEVAESRLAPLGAAPQVAQLGPGGRTLRVLALAGQLAFLDLDMGRPNARPVDGAPGALRGRWQRAVGLTLDSRGRVRSLPLNEGEGTTGDADSVN